MARNMIAANAAIFLDLDRYCASRGSPINNAGKARWIATLPEERRILKESVVSGQLLFSPRRGLARVDHGTQNYFCAIGFDCADAPYGLVESEIDAGLLTTVLAELKVQPKATPAEVRNIVDASDKEADPLYSGHDSKLMRALYPDITLFEGKQIASEETWKLFFLLCLAGCRVGHSWIEPELANELQMLAELPLLNVPYRTLCRSIFDTDPGALFLALYRCMEAIYAFSSARALINALNLSHDWADIAVALERTIGWYPREEGSLVALFRHGSEMDHKSVFSALGEQPPEPTSGPISAASARRIYKMRNDLVHYRPSQARVDYSLVNWNSLCAAATALVCYIYAEVFVV